MTLNTLPKLIMETKCVTFQLCALTAKIQAWSEAVVSKFFTISKKMVLKVQILCAPVLSLTKKCPFHS